MQINMRADDALILLDIGRRFIRPSGCDQAVQAACFIELTAHSANVLMNKSKIVPTQHTFDERIITITDFINNTYMNEINLKTIADAVCLHPSSLSRLFNSKTGYNLVEYINEVRIKNACRIMKHEKKNIAQVACLCGYNNLSLFNRVFKRLCSVTPREFSKRIQIEESPVSHA